MKFGKTLLTSAMLIVAAQATHAAVVYREVFPNDFVTSPNNNQAEQATAQGWFGARHGSAQDTQGSQPGQIAKDPVGGSNAGNTELAPINSNPQGPIASTGYFFWSPVQVAGSFLYTNEVAALNLSTAAITSVTWDSRNNTDPNRTETLMRVALRLVGSSDWYIADIGEQHNAGPTTWETNSFTFAGKTFQLFDDHNSGETSDRLPRNNDGSTGLSLPAGTIGAIGLWIQFTYPIPNTASSNIRLDNFTIEADVSDVPAPLTAALLGTSLLGLAGLRRRSR